MATNKKTAAPRKRASRAPTKRKPGKITPRQLYEAHRWIPLDEVAQLPGNPNVGHQASLDASVDEFGWFDGLVVHQGVLIAGNGRYRRAVRDNEEGLPGYDLSWLDLDDARRMAMAIVHNQSNRLGADDPQALLDALEAMPPDLVDVTFIDLDTNRSNENASASRVRSCRRPPDGTKR